MNVNVEQPLNPPSTATVVQFWIFVFVIVAAATDCRTRTTTYAWSVAYTPYIIATYTLAKYQNQTPVRPPQSMLRSHAASFLAPTRAVRFSLRNL
jgi:hypothetical protein